MNQNKIIECARKAGALIGRPLAPHEFSIHNYTFSEVELTRFANLVAQHQKEKDTDIAKSFDRSPSYKAAEAIRSQE